MTTFNDGKDEGALRTIGEVGKALGLKPHVLRYWEEQFPMLQPLKRSGNRRYYRPEDVALVETIDRLVNHEGYTLKGAKQAIEEGRAAMAEAGQPRPAVEPDAPASSDPFEDDSPVPATHAPEPEDTPDSVPAVTSPTSPAVPQEVIAELKDIRAKLAAAVGA